MKRLIPFDTHMNYGPMRMALIEHEAREYSDMRYIMRKAEMSIK